MSARAAAPKRPSFQEFQFEFTRHIRDPKANPRPDGVPARRMKVYNELLFNNLEGFLLACFPVLRQILGKRKWTALVRDFFAEHRCHTPFFRQIPDEFIQYLQAERGEQESDPPFLRELAHYEWIELVLSVSNKEAPAKVDLQGDLQTGIPVLNPVLSLLEYAYPVQRIGPRFKPTAPTAEPTHLLVFRNAEFDVRFIQLNAVSTRLLALLVGGDLTGREALERIAKELKHPAPDAVISGGLEILQNLRAEQAILGTLLQ
jgi:hypothetical protein